MLQLSQIQGAIFDIDDTLLSNHPGGQAHGLHERSRLAAIHEIGRLRNIPELEHFSVEANITTFLTAKVHSLEGAMWNTLLLAGLVQDEDIDHNHLILQELVRRKNELHEDILRQEGREVPGATAFVKALAAHGLHDKLAIASTAYRRDIDIFLDLYHLQPLFPDHRIISGERLTHPKPHPHAFSSAFASLGLPEGAQAYVLAVEDDPRGITSAKAAGLFTCAITTRFSKAALAALPVAPDLIIGSYAELNDALLSVDR